MRTGDLIRDLAFKKFTGIILEELPSAYMSYGDMCELFLVFWWDGRIQKAFEEDIEVVGKMHNEPQKYKF